MMFPVVHVVELIAVLISAVCVIIAALHRPNEGQKLTVITAITIFLICLGVYGKNLAPDEALMVYANKIEYFGACNAFSAFVILYGIYLGIHIPKWLKGLMLVSGYVMTIITCTFDLNTLYYRSYSVKIVNGIPELVKVYGPLHSVYVAMACIYTAAVIMMYLYCRYLRKNNRRFFSRLLAAVAVAPTAAFLIEKMTGSGVELLPYGLIVSDVCLIYLIGNRFYDLNEVALDVVYETSVDAVIIENMEHEFQGANKLARSIFPEFCRDGSRQRHKIDTAAFADRQRQLVALYQDKIPFEYENRKYQIGYRTLIAHDKEVGYILTLKDITVELEHTKLLESYREELEKDVALKTAQLQNFQEKMLFGFSSVVENRRAGTGGHIRKTSLYASALGEELWQEGKYADIIKKDFLKRLQRVVVLHDIGKIVVPDRILEKSGKLTDEEYDLVKTHTVEGAKIVDILMKDTGDKKDYDMAREIVLYHHEYWNGSGYPEGLTRTQIPVAARIMAVADVFDALVSDRPYRPAYTVEKAFQILQEENETHFDPLILAVFMKIRPEIEKINIQEKAD